MLTLAKCQNDTRFIPLNQQTMRSYCRRLCGPFTGTRFQFSDSLKTIIPHRNSDLSPFKHGKIYLSHCFSHERHGDER